ncbi:hypothetical protein CYMTET_32725, partial [Cymbomonas tetramitiformis]
MHNDVWKEVDAKIRQDKEEKVDPGEVARGNNQSDTLTGKEGSVWSESRKKDIDEKFAYWVAKNKRPVSSLEDDEFRLTLKDATRGAYQPPDHTKAKKEITRMASKGMERVLAKSALRRQEGFKPCLAGDIWADGEVSIMTILQYSIDRSFAVTDKYHRTPTGFHVCGELVTAVPFVKDAHTADNIEVKLTAELAAAEFPVTAPGMGVFDCVSDN